MMLINQTTVKKRALELIRENRPALADKFSRISGDFCAAFDRRVDELLGKFIMTVPTSGKTLRPPV